MSLVNLLIPVDHPEGLAWFSFGHADDHRAIDVALAGLGVVSGDVQLDPMPPLDDAGAIFTWLQSHQQKHFDMNQALGLDSSSLISYDFSRPEQLTAFIDDNYAEHDSVHQAFGAQGISVGS